MGVTALAPSSADDPAAYQQVALVDLLDRVLATGVVITGDITLAIADVDLVRISLRALVASVGALVPPGSATGPLVLPGPAVGPLAPADSVGGPPAPAVLP
ncbi:gas vesicle protein [Micromonospora humi]|uniref:Gas vesicle protein n=1 Tax=Micromonospora humi TaxID=745366 RepID=A0A1C5JXS4_9ACTN|nr:gas vesicle protein [Micromonospora humi]SCG75365.1 Gas vesicle protein [Micromonospora humi]